MTLLAEKHISDKYISNLKYFRDKVNKEETWEDMFLHLVGLITAAAAAS